MESVEKTHPFIQFSRAWKIGEDTWFALGQCKGIIRAISSAPLMPAYRRDLFEVTLIKGAMSTTAIEGNTLSEEEIRKIHSGGSVAPGKEYMENEVRNVLNALKAINDELLQSDETLLITPELIRRFHRLIGQNLGSQFAAIPGKFRKNNVTVGGIYRPPDHRSVESLINKLCDWSRKEFHHDRGQNFSTAIIQAIIMHVYIAWIHPFGDGNGRTARLVEFCLLLRAGVPDIASHILSNYYNKTRNEYYRQLSISQKSRNLTSFIEYTITGFKEGLKETLAVIQKNQLDIAWSSYVFEVFEELKAKNITKPVRKRQTSLVLSIDLDKEYSEAEILSVKSPLSIIYSSLSERTLLRDLEALETMGLLIREEGYFRANTEILRKNMAEAIRPVGPG